MFHQSAFVYGSLFFPSCFFIIYYVLDIFFPKRLSIGDKCSISVSCVSSTQAILSSVAGYHIIRECKDIMHDRHWLTNYYACFGLPYFFYDIFAMCLTDFHLKPQFRIDGLLETILNYMRRNPLITFHHLVFPVIFFPIIIFFRNGIGDYFLGCIYMIEMAVPFVSIRNILAQVQFKHSPLYVISGFAMLGAFFTCRILIFPFLFWSYAQYKFISVWQVPRHIPIKCLVGSTLLLLPQVYWVGLMLQGACKVFHRMYLRYQQSSTYHTVSPVMLPTS